MVVYCGYCSAAVRNELPVGSFFTFHGSRFEKIHDGEYPEALHLERVGGSNRFSYAEGGVLRVLGYTPVHDKRGGYRMSYEEVSYEEYQAEQSA